MKVSNKQLEQLGQVHFQKFTEDMLLHARTWFPEHLEASGEPAIRETIQLCIRRAKQYGFVSARNICLYLNAMLAWGSFFDTDPQHNWAQQILNDRSIPNPTTRINALSDASEDAWVRIQGADQEHQLACFAAILQDRDRVFRIAGAEEQSAVIGLLQELYPQKAAVLDRSGLRELAARARTAPAPATSGSLSGFLMTLLGAGFQQDPQFPWTDTVLRDRLQTADERQEALWAGALAHMNRFLSSVENTVT